MNRMLFKWQIVGCGVLASILLAEWLVGALNRSELDELLNRTTNTDYQADPLPELQVPKPLAGNFSAIIERPLFIEGRKPLAEATDASKDKTQEIGQLEDWLLIGIYNKDRKQFALFRKQNEAKKFLKLNEQQMIAGWQLKQIQSDRVILQSAGQEKAVPLRKPRPQLKKPMPPRPGAAVPAANAAQPVEPNPTNNLPSENNENDN